MTNHALPELDFNTFLSNVLQQKKNGVGQKRLRENNTNHEYVNNLRAKLKESLDVQEELEEAIQVTDEDKILVKELFEKYNGHKVMRQSMLNLLALDVENQEQEEIQIEDSPNLIRILVMLLKKEVSEQRVQTSVLEATNKLLQNQLFELRNEFDCYKSSVEKQKRKYEQQMISMADKHASSGQQVQNLEKEKQALQQLIFATKKQLDETKQQLDNVANQYANIFQERQKNAREHTHKVLNDSFLKMCDLFNETVGQHEQHRRLCPDQSKCWCDEVGDFRNKLNPLMDAIRLCVTTNLC